MSFLPEDTSSIQSLITSLMILGALSGKKRRGNKKGLLTMLMEQSAAEQKRAQQERAARMSTQREIAPVLLRMLHERGGADTDVTKLLPAELLDVAGIDPSALQALIKNRLVQKAAELGESNPYLSSNPDAVAALRGIDSDEALRDFVTSSPYLRGKQQGSSFDALIANLKSNPEMLQKATPNDMSAMLEDPRIFAMLAGELEKSGRDMNLGRQERFSNVQSGNAKSVAAYKAGLAKDLAAFKQNLKSGTGGGAQYSKIATGIDNAFKNAPIGKDDISDAILDTSNPMKAYGMGKSMRPTIDAMRKELGGIEGANEFINKSIKNKMSGLASVEENSELNALAATAGMTGERFAIRNMKDFEKINTKLNSIKLFNSNPDAKRMYFQNVFEVDPSVRKTIESNPQTKKMFDGYFTQPSNNMQSAIISPEEEEFDAFAAEFGRDLEPDESDLFS